MLARYTDISLLEVEARLQGRLKVSKETDVVIGTPGRDH
jgi:hypothetical protein